MSIDWNWGIFFTTSPVRQHHLSWLDLEWLSGDDRFVDLRPDYRFPRRFIFRHFTYRSKPFSLRSGYVVCRTVPQRAVDCAILYPVPVIPELLPEKIGMWFKAELDPNIQFSFHPCSAWAVYRRPCLRTGTRRYSVAAAWAKNAALAMGLTLPQAYRYVLLPNAYRVIVPPMTSEMMNSVKTRPSPRLSVWWIWRRRRVNCSITRPTPESFTAITLAYVLINAFIMLVMTLVERKVRLPGNMGANNVRV